MVEKVPDVLAGVASILRTSDSISQISYSALWSGKIELCPLLACNNSCFEL